MQSLPADKIPHFDNTEGMRYRNKQLLLQLPVQDTQFEQCKHLPEKSKYAFDQFVKNREADMATGHVERAFRVKVHAFFINNLSQGLVPKVTYFGPVLIKCEYQKFLSSFSISTAHSVP